MEVVVESARALAAEEYNRAERLDRKALNLATVIGAFFSLSQIVVVNVIDQVPESKHDDLRLFGIAAVALAALSVGLALAVFLPWRERNFPAEHLTALLGGAEKQSPTVARNLVMTYKATAESRRSANKWRARIYLAATVLGAFAIAATAAELAIALFAITQ